MQKTCFPGPFRHIHKHVHSMWLTVNDWHWCADQIEKWQTVSIFLSIQLLDKPTENPVEWQWKTLHETRLECGWLMIGSTRCVCVMCLTSSQCRVTEQIPHTHTDEWIYLQSQKINELKEGLKDLAAAVGVTVTQLIKSWSNKLNYSCHIYHLHKKNIIMFWIEKIMSPNVTCCVMRSHAY